MAAAADVTVKERDVTVERVAKKMRDELADKFKRYLRVMKQEFRYTTERGS